MKKVISGLLSLTVVLIGVSSCDEDAPEYKKIVLRQLYNSDLVGSIEECNYNGQIVYTVGLNAYDAGSGIYDKEGKSIGNCNFAWGKPDSICGKLTGCETVYMVKDNIWGRSPVDKYGLGK